MVELWQPASEVSGVRSATKIRRFPSKEHASMHLKHGISRVVPMLNVCRYVVYVCRVYQYIQQRTARTDSIVMFVLVCSSLDSMLELHELLYIECRVNVLRYVAQNFATSMWHHVSMRGRFSGTGIVDLSA